MSCILNGARARWPFDPTGIQAEGRPGQTGPTITHSKDPRAAGNRLSRRDPATGEGLEKEWLVTSSILLPWKLREVV